LTVAVSAEGENVFTVKTYLDSYLVHTQTVSSASELSDNDFVIFDRSAQLAESGGAAFTGGADGEATSAEHAAFLARLEEKSFNTLALASNDNILKNLYRQYTVRMRDEVGVKFQTVLYNCAADHEGIVNVGCAAAGSDPAGFVYWAAGLNAGTLVNETALNRVYAGEYELRDNYSIGELSEMISRGEFTLHRVGDELRVLADINSLVNTTAEKGEIFKDNRVVRVADRIAADTVRVFTEKYLGRIPNNASGRISLWADIISLLGVLRDGGAIEEFDSDEITVEAGEDKHAVIVGEAVTVTGSMAKLYMTCVLG
ncbi:MAG: phage tail sheath subtilisin-like domain-containing protein, partial [Clostridia bacterium]|nr:phage tail sheath subtilisin-like domain-containing protein [Clostridia bacterium]